LHHYREVTYTGCLGAFCYAAHECVAAGTIDWRVVFSSRATLDRQRRTQRAEQRSFLVAPSVTVVRSVFSVAFPPDCRICSLLLTPIHVPQRVLCGERLLPSQLLVGDGRCHGCREFDPEFDRAVSLGEYAGALHGIVHLLKYAGVLPVAPVLGRLLAEAIAQLGRNDEDAKPLLVPVPLRSSERGERGFNPAELIVRSALKRPPRRMEVATVFERQRATHSPVGRAREEGVANMRGAFRVADERVKGRTVIVVDDVMTTGTVVSECARVLKRAGAGRVGAATLARTLQDAALPVSVERGKEEESEAAAKAVSV
jgi:ComF family protein